ncbi:MAG: YggS family pyridoxal phosphate-dependent enzyme [Bacteroidaceae bacterium]|nr:YggS family pyridoxal phosphate-dependent enzyme [Bacteroidaceae bacterium]
MSISSNIEHLRSSLPSGVSLLAISKYQPIEALREAYDAGQRMFGENHIQEMAAKASVLPCDIEWHFTGHVQTNKIKYMAPFVSLIHAVDSFRLLREIDKHAAKHDRVIDCLLQIHIAQEDTKYGFTIDECRTMLATEPWRELRHVRITGLMAMGSNTDDMEQVRSEFRQMKVFFDELRSTHFADEPPFCQLSEGMTDDYPIAIEEGSTIVRIGSMIFGERQYK